MSQERRPHAAKISSTLLLKDTMVDESNELKLAQVMAATAEMLSSVIRLLEERGLVGSGEFASAFERCADVAEKDLAGSPFPLGFPRYDILMMRQTAKILRRRRKAGGWQPTIIQGGLSEQKTTDEESDSG